eukprot:COSAG01_NODE_1898_length_8965_cov_8.656366_5_plen_202_part_00
MTSNLPGRTVSVVGEDAGSSSDGSSSEEGKCAAELEACSSSGGGELVGCTWWSTGSMAASTDVEDLDSFSDSSEDGTGANAWDSCAADQQYPAPGNLPGQTPLVIPPLWRQPLLGHEAPANANSYMPGSRQGLRRPPPPAHTPAPARSVAWGGRRRASRARGGGGARCGGRSLTGGVILEGVDLPRERGEHGGVAGGGRSR